MTKFEHLEVSLGSIKTY